MTARVRRAFWVSQGSVDILFRWGGNVYMLLQLIYSGNSVVPNFIHCTISPAWADWTPMHAHF